MFIQEAKVNTADIANACKSNSKISLPDTGVIFVIPFIRSDPHSKLTGIITKLAGNIQDFPCSYFSHVWLTIAIGPWSAIGFEGELNSS